MRYISWPLISMIIFLGSSLQAQVSDKDITEAAVSSLTTFRELLAIPNDAIDADDIDKNIKWCTDQLEKRGWTTHEWLSPTIPHLFAERTTNPELETVLFYFHLDGQSVDGRF